MPASSLTDKAHQQIKSWILRFELKPGARLLVGDLARALQMSQTPVREALSMLEKERLIERQPQRGYRVCTLSLQEVEDLYDLRIALEVLAVRQAASRMTAADRRRLTATLREFGRLLRSGRKKPVLERGQDFHMIVLEASGNRALAEVARAVLDRIWVIQNINLLTADHLADAHPEHVGILAAMKRGDEETAAALMHRHLGVAKDFVLSRLRNSEDILSRMTRGTSLSKPHS